MFDCMNFKPVNVSVLEQLTQNGAHEDQRPLDCDLESVSSFKSGFRTQSAGTLAHNPSPEAFIFQ